jgi:hypothetical protein
MDGDVLAEAGGTCGLDADHVHGLSADGLSRDVAGEEPFGWACGLPVFAEQGEQAWREHDVAILAALALADTDDHALAVDVVGAE